MPLHPRRVLDLVRARLASRAITVLTGARQTGKTTLVRDLLPAATDRATVYLSLDTCRSTIPTSACGSPPTRFTGWITARAS